MFLLNTLNLLLDSSSNEESRSFGAGATESCFAAGQLTSAAWEGWWHEDTAQH
ncbi:hypothetical protein V1639_11755 [Pseudarthrobacter sp. J75]|uniref:hypothetical protein n=1 Tax=unclassified Pseudarthrobacter TaxID=2647000 RepID=UPI002E81529D|nr:MULTISPECIES: hypothetical protein [unclassified Pseudarthrobacter]MEE2523011.1 hypothetical protein [Pseudarthrobacter sp. J47]MEE2529694.1 hypothetical protein [Pseudarthrobacter sp. J75]MEE2569003.1 hypothetical protein [Pseudarthrobacter sp. J64]